MEIALRSASAADAIAVADLIIASRVAFLPFAPLLHSREQMRRWASEVLIPSERVTVAIRDSTIVGVVSTSVEKEIIWLNQLYVAPSFVSQGMGAQLLSHALSDTRGTVQLYTFRDNQGARRFYQRHGFIEAEHSDGSGNEEKCPDVLCIRVVAA